MVGLGDFVIVIFHFLFLSSQTDPSNHRAIYSEDLIDMGMKFRNRDSKLNMSDSKLAHKPVFF